jgi:hypothetical protein
MCGQAYKATMARFNAAVVAEGGFTWMLMKGKAPRVRPTFNRHIGENVTVNTSACTAILRESCVPHPPAWREATLYLIREPWEVLEQGDQVGEVSRRFDHRRVPTSVLTMQTIVPR